MHKVRVAFVLALCVATVSGCVGGNLVGSALPSAAGLRPADSVGGGPPHPIARHGAVGGGLSRVHNNRDNDSVGGGPPNLRSHRH